MKQYRNRLYKIIAVLLYLAIWEGAARWLDLPFAIPTIGSTFDALIHLVTVSEFWITVLSSLARIMLGLLLGTIGGTILAALSAKSEFARALIAPAQTMIRCTPVASFIIVLWIIIGRDTVPCAIAVLMVSPVIWKGLLDGYTELDHSLDEVLSVHGISGVKRLRLLVIPGLKASFFTAFTTSAGLAWKAGIAAEIITYTTNSIGRQIADARNMFDGAQMMAWTICVIILSMILEKVIAQTSKRLGREN